MGLDADSTRVRAQGKPFRLAVLNSHPIQYFAPLFRYLHKDPDLDVTVLYCTDFSLRGAVDPGFKQSVKWDVDLLSGYNSIFLGEDYKTRAPAGFWSLICPEVWREVRKGGYDALLLHGYNYAANLIAFLAAKSAGIPVIVRSETHLELRRSRVKRVMRDSLLRLAYRWVNAFFAIGTANRAYYAELGAKPDSVFFVPYTVDNDRFIAQATITTEERNQVRKKLGIRSNETVILYASKLMRRKHPDDLLRAVKALHDEGIEASLLIVGTGEMEAELRAYADENRMRNVHFAGFLNQTELPKVFAASDVFVLPSENEPWGLIVNEAMCAGLPLVVSSEVGCVADLLTDGINGYKINAGDVQSLTSALRRLLNDEPTRSSMGQASLRIIRQWSYEQCREGVLAAAKKLRG